MVGLSGFSFSVGGGVSVTTVGTSDDVDVAVGNMVGARVRVNVSVSVAVAVPVAVANAVEMSSGAFCVDGTFVAVPNCVARGVETNFVAGTVCVRVRVIVALAVLGAPA